MPMFDRLLEIINQMRGDFEELALVVAQMAKEEDGAARSAAQPAAVRDATGYDLTKVIPPTRTEAPDSIVGGLPTMDFPDCCAIGDDSEYYCTGTLIAPNLVVSAEHCGTCTRVFLKGHDIDQPDTGETIEVKKQFVHDTMDLRVLVLEEDSTVTPRHVAQEHEVAGTTCTLVGFGTIDLNGTKGYGLKRMVEVPIISLNCDSADDQQQHRCVPGEVVAGHRGLLRDSCKGDSGGPLYIQDDQGNFHLLAATSRGSADSAHMCGDGGVYVRVDLLLDWIKEKTEVDIPGPLS